MELVVTGNQEKAPGTYTLTVTGLTGDDAGNYQLGSASGYTMDWSITITNQTPATIQLVDGNGQPLTEVGIYWNLENDRDHLTLGKDVVAQVRDENGFEYILRGGEEIQWTFTRIEGEEGCCKLEGDTLTAYYGTGSGTLTATLGELKAELKVTAGKFETISGISPGGVADYVRLGQAYDLSAIPLSATAYGGAPYTLTQAQKDSIQWSLASGNGYNTGVEASFDEDKKTLTVTKAGLDENLEGTVTLVGTLTDNGAGEAVTTNYVTLTVRQASKAATLSVELLQGAAGITMSPNDSKPITNYLAVTCTDQYGDPFPMDMLSWTSGNEDVVSIVAGQFLRSGSEDGTTTIYATVGDGVESQEIQVTVAGTPRLTAIQITGAPQRMLTGDTLDLDTLKILCLDQYGEEIAYSGQAAWAVENVSGAGAAIANRTLRAGESAGTFNLTAAINADISHYVTIMVVEAKVDGLSLSRTSLGSRGGSVTVTLTGESLPESVTLGLFAANAAEPVVTAESNAVEDDAESGTERAVSLAVPANTSTEAAVNYTVKVSYDNGISYDTQPTANLTVAAYTGGGGGGGGGGAAAEPEQFGVTVSGSIRNGRVSVSPSQAAEGELVTITVTPNEGFVLDKLTVTGAKGEALEVTDAGGGRFTFAMPDSDVTIDTAFVEGSGQTGLPFDDVDSGDWFYEAVKYAYEIGMMSGISQVSFGPGDNLTRGMIAQILYSLDEKPASSGSTAFTDILSGAWYADAVSWAAENGLMGGYGDGLFGPEDNITREQMAQILYNYALYMGYDISARGDLSGYRDAASTSAWARTAMEWAVGSGLFYGYDGWLNPTGTATRAEVAQILMNFCQYNAQKT